MPTDMKNAPLEDVFTTEELLALAKALGNGWVPDECYLGWRSAAQRVRDAMMRLEKHPPDTHTLPLPFGKRKKALG